MSGEPRELEEFPSWLTSKLDQRLAQMKEAVGNILDDADYTVIMLSLTDPPEDDAQRQAWEDGCDNCSKSFPEGSGLLVGCAQRHFNKHVIVSITFGSCHDCIVLP